MHVEQGHHAQRHIVRPQLVGGHDVAHRGIQVAVPQGNALGTARGSAGVKHERGVIRRGLRNGRGPGLRSLAVQAEPAITVDVRLDQGTQVEGPSRGGRIALRHQKKTCADVLQVIAELGLRVCRVERAGGSDVRRRQKEDDSLRSGGKDHRHAVTGADAERCQAARSLVDQLAQPAIGDDRAVGDHNRDGIGPSAGKNRRHVRHVALILPPYGGASGWGLAYRARASVPPISTGTVRATPIKKSDR